jgi:hypothetical protein
MPLPVQLRAVVDELAAVDDEWRAYINGKTGELASFSLDLMRSIENEEDPSKRPDWERDQRQDCERVLNDPDFILLPSKFDIHEWSIMERFCRSFDDEAIGDRLLDAIHGRGAFRMFKNEVHRLGIQDDWYRYRDDALKKIAADFLEAHGIPYVDDKARPGVPPSEAG